MPNIISLSWKDFSNIVNETCENIKKSELPDIIIAVQRGGFVPAVILSHNLGVRDIMPLGVKITADDNINSQKLKPVLTPNSDISKIAGKNILIVDDIAGSGETFKITSEYLSKYNPLSIKSFICVVNLDNWEKNIPSKPSEKITYIGKTVRGWIVFPWEKQE